MNTIRTLAEIVLVRFFFLLAGVVPRRVVLALGTLCGTLGNALDRRHRRIAMANIRAAFGDSMDEREARRIVRRCWAHFGRILFDSLNFPKFSAASVDRIVRYEGLEHIRRAYDRGRGVLLFSAHYGHWELVALMQGFLGLPLSLVTRPLDNPRLERFLAQLRCRSGNAIIHRRGAIREMLRTLGDGRGVAIVIDQDARGQGVFVPFFGRPASTTPTLALLALKTHAAIVPVFSVPLPDGSYRVVYEPVVDCRPTHDRSADIERITAECTAIIERWVRRHPELWLWMHRRWKTPPPRGGEEEDVASSDHHGS